MKILKQKINEMVNFDSLACGEPFYFEDNLWIKAKNYRDCDLNTVRVSDGLLTTLENNPLVEVAHVHVEDDKDD